MILEDIFDYIQRMLKTFLLSFLMVILASAVTLAQEENQIEWTDVLRELGNSDLPGNSVWIQDKEIVFNELNNYWGLDDFLATELGHLIKDASGRFVFPNQLRLTNCVFIGDLELSDLVFSSVTIEDSKGEKIRVANSRIIQLRIEKSEISDLELIALSSFDVQILENQVELISLQRVTINGSISLGDNRVEEVFVEDSDFTLGKGLWFNIFSRTESIDPIDLTMDRNHFRGEGAIILNAHFLNLYVREDSIDVNLFFKASKAVDRFVMISNVFGSKVYFDYFLFSETRNELYWDQFSGGKIGYADQKGVYNADTLIENQDNVRFRNLISSYKALHNIFINRGDIQSANDCYNEMKELEGKWLKHQFEVNSTFANYFRWMLNRLLKHYTNHGTDPALAVVVSCIVIFIFAVLYIFFPSEWDQEHNESFRTGMRLLGTFSTKTNAEALQKVAGVGSIILINAITLSLNSFVTLGFGSIPTKGFARYLCIIEGFIGWFLLSIFTVALINQVLA